MASAGEMVGVALSEVGGIVRVTDFAATRGEAPDSAFFGDLITEFRTGRHPSADLDTMRRPS